MAALKSTLREQVVSVTFKVTESFFLYDKGIFNPKDCRVSKATNNHALLAVGFGNENSVEYVILRSSGGSSWGESGYIRVALIDDSTGVCGMYLNIIGAQQ